MESPLIEYIMTHVYPHTYILRMCAKLNQLFALSPCSEEAKCLPIVDGILDRDYYDESYLSRVGLMAQDKLGVCVYGVWCVCMGCGGCVWGVVGVYGVWCGCVGGWVGV